jgi:hypothetical protein
MPITITSDIAKQYLLTEDAVEGFNIAVENGQVRLALQVMAEIVDGIMEVLDYLVEQTNDESENINEEIKPVEIFVESKKLEVEETKKETETTPTKKVTAKESATKEDKAVNKIEAE